MIIRDLVAVIACCSQVGKCGRPGCYQGNMKDISEQELPTG